MSEPIFASPLAHRSAAENVSIGLHEITTRGMIDLRGLTTDRKFMAAAKQVLGLDLPKVPRTSAAWGDVKALWLSPDQWLILCARERPLPCRLNSPKRSKAFIPSRLMFQTCAASFAWKAEGVRETLMKGCSLDFGQR